MKKPGFLLLIGCCFYSFLFAQPRTVGLLENSPDAYNGYTLFGPSTNGNTYLIDNCGFAVNEWLNSGSPGLSVYLTDNGDLLRTRRINAGNGFAGGGIGGRLLRLDWDNAIVWQYELADSSHHQHHDVEQLPNGNILYIAWERISAQEVLDNGRDPNFIGNELWPDKIVEIEPFDADSFTVVWEWRFWDHLIQDFDATKLNYGVVADHPELIDLNIPPFGNPIASDWNHTNGVSYHPGFDQIMISIRNFNEIFIIDHSTTTAEAASHSGGNSGKGGDILYRWGNPENYGRGTAADRQFFLQHNATWVPPGYPNEGKILVYNNGVNRPGGSISSVDMFAPPVDSSGNYFISGIDPFLPDTLFWSFSDSAFYSVNISGAQALPNGNVLVCEGVKGHFFEVDLTADTIVWEYINPVTNSGPVPQGTFIPGGNNTFRAERYAPDFSGFDGKDLTPGLELELYPYPSTCLIYLDTMVTDTMIIDTTVSIAPHFFPKEQIKIYPNPIVDQFIIDQKNADNAQIIITDLQGRIIHESVLKKSVNTISSKDWSSGMYIMKVRHPITNKIGIYKIIK